MFSPCVFSYFSLYICLHLSHEELYLPVLDHTAPSDPNPAPPPYRRDSAGSPAPVGPGGAAGPGTGSPDFLSRSPPSALPGQKRVLHGRTTSKSESMGKYPAALMHTDYN